jgi:hypothetical protein
MSMFDKHAVSCGSVCSVVQTCSLVAYKSANSRRLLFVSIASTTLLLATAVSDSNYNASLLLIVMLKLSLLHLVPLLPLCRL